MQNIFIELLPPWIETGLQPAFYDKESGTVLQQVSRMWAKMIELGQGFNTFSTNVTDTVNSYITQFNELYTYVHDYFDNLDVQEEINNKLDDMADAGQLADIISQYLNSIAIFGYDNVASMKSATNLVDGSYARTLGYYAENDGGGSLYAIVDDSSLVDDGGSILTLNSGLKAILIPNGEVNYNQFGAKLDGVTSDKTPIENCHAYANEHKLTVNQNGGRAIGDFKANVKTSCKFTNFTLVRSDSYVDRNYTISPDSYTLSEEINLNITDNYTGSIGGYTNKSFTITTNNSTWSLGVRNITGGVEGHHTQPVVLDNEGNIISSPIWKACNGTFILSYIQDVNTPRLVFDGLVIEENSDKYGYTIAVECFRNNTTISNISVLSMTDPTSSDYNSFGAIYVHDCINAIIEKVNGRNHTANSSVTAYILTVSKAFNVNIRDIFGYQRWGIIATHFIDTMNISNCYMNRLDNHYGAFGRFSFRDCTLIGQSAINIGYGNADVYIDNINVKEANINYQGFVRYREDYYCTFSGNLYISNCNIDNKNYLIYYSYKTTQDGNASTFDNKALRYRLMNVTFSSGIPRLSLVKTPNNIYCTVINTSFNMSGISAINGGEQFYSNAILSNVNGKNISAFGSTVNGFSTTETLTAGSFNGCNINDYPRVSTGKTLFNGCTITINGNNFNQPSGAGTSYLTGCSARNATTTNNLSVTVTGCYNIS